MSDAGDLRLVTVLVTDIVDSTPIGERLGPERSKPLFDEVSRLLAAQVERFGGIVAQHTGDGLLAFFGAPVAHGDDAERAVRAALAMQSALEPFAREAEAAYGVSIRARVAINTGRAAVPRGDQPLDSLYNALGDTVTVAGRLQSFADPGGVIAGPVTAAELSDLFAFERLGDLELKGKSQRVTAFRLTGERAPASEPTSTLVGRDIELATICAVLDDAVDGRGGVLVITGEPGIGKSRLMDEGRTRTPVMTFLEGHGASYQESSPYWPVQGLLRGWLGLELGAPDLQVRLELKARLSRLCGEAALDMYPFVAMLLGLPLEAEQANDLRDVSADSIQQRTFAAFEAVLAAELRLQPVCVVFDDLHWADEATLALIEHVLELTDEHPLVVVLSYRSERDHGAWTLGHFARTQFPHRFTEIDLTALAARAVAELAVDAAGADLPDAVVELLADRCGGNPFFIEQAVLDLVESGSLVRVDERFDVFGGLNSGSVPVRIQETLQARLDRLQPADREVVTAASVIGRSFGSGLLGELVADPHLMRRLASLQRLELVHELRRRPVSEYEFRHGLVREVAYASLLEPRRRSLHQQVGETLERWASGGMTIDDGLLAGHFAQAGDARRAADYLLRAGDHARSVFAERDAVVYYRQAIPFLRELGDVERERQTQFRLALSHFLASEFALANAHYSQAFALSTPEPVRAVPTEDLFFPQRLEPESLTPGFGNSESAWQMTSYIFRGLFRSDSESSVVADLAGAMTVSDDGLDVEIEVAPGYLWEDRAPVVAADFVYTWQEGRRLRLEAAHLHGEIESVSAVSESRIALRLVRPLPHLLYLLCQPPTFPRPMHLADVPSQAADSRVIPVGNGPFRMTSWTSTTMEFEASDTWIGRRGNVRRVEVDIRPLVEARGPLRSYDLVQDPAEHADQVLDGDLIVANRLHETSLLAFAARTGPWSDLNVRRALAVSIDRTVLDMDRDGVPADGGLIPPSLLGHAHHAALPYDPELAAELLAQAGHPGGAGLPVLRLVTWSSWATTRSTFDEFRRMWGDLGIDLEVRGVAFGREMTGAEDVDAYATGWVADYPDPAGMLGSFLAVYPQVVPTDPRVQQLLTDIRLSQTRNERIDRYRSLDRLLVSELVALVPLAYGSASCLVRPWVHGYWRTPVHVSTADELTVVGRPAHGPGAVHGLIAHSGEGQLASE